MATPTDIIIDDALLALWGTDAESLRAQVKRAVLYHRLRADECDDVLQDTVVRVLKKMRRDPPDREALPGIICGAAHRTFQNHCDRMIRQRAREAPLDPETVAASAASSELVYALHEAMAEDEDRLIVYLHLFQGHTFREVERLLSADPPDATSPLAGSRGERRGRSAGQSARTRSNSTESLRKRFDAAKARIAHRLRKRGWAAVVIARRLDLDGLVPAPGGTDAPRGPAVPPRLAPWAWLSLVVMLGLFAAIVAWPPSVAPPVPAGPPPSLHAQGREPAAGSPGDERPPPPRTLPESGAGSRHRAPAPRFTQRDPLLATCFPRLAGDHGTFSRIEVATMLLAWLPPTDEELAAVYARRERSPEWRWSDVGEPPRTPTSARELLRAPAPERCDEQRALVAYLAGLRDFFHGGDACFGRAARCAFEPERETNAAELAAVICRMAYWERSGECVAPRDEPRLPAPWSEPPGAWFVAPAAFLLQEAPQESGAVLTWLNRNAPGRIVDRDVAEALLRAVLQDSSLIDGGADPNSTVPEK